MARTWTDPDGTSWTVSLTTPGQSMAVPLAWEPGGGDDSQAITMVFTPSGTGGTPRRAWYMGPRMVDPSELSDETILRHWRNV